MTYIPTLQHLACPGSALIFTIIILKTNHNRQPSLSIQSYLSLLVFLLSELLFYVPQSNQISEIPTGSLPSGLAEISMNDNPITSIDNNAFNQLSTTLQALYFSSANFTRIPDAFLRLNGLQRLTITESKILDWNTAAMTHIGQTLQTLTLDNVGFTTWPDWLHNFSRLTEQNIVNSAISSIPDTAFDKYGNSLITLSLYNNSFTAIPSPLSVLNNLITLDLHGNKISNITSLPQSGKLSDVSLSNNYISDASHLSDVLRLHSDSLLSLTLSFNRLTVIPDLSFLTKITSLDLNNNQISDAFSGSVSVTIDELNFGYNLLPHIPNMYKNLQIITFMNLPHNSIREVLGTDIPLWITDLDLDYNLITELTDSSFPVNSSLKGLTLDNVPLVKISSLAFVNLGSLISLSLVNTRLTRLPLSLAYLTGVRYLDLRNNDDLVCTCLEKSLAPIVNSGLELSGNCGYISIYTFFSILSANCP